MNERPTPEAQSRSVAAPRPVPPGRIRRLLTWIGAHEPQTLAVLILIAGGVWLFAELADEVLEGETAHFDERVLLRMLRRSLPRYEFEGNSADRRRYFLVEN